MEQAGRITLIPEGDTEAEIIDLPPPPEGLDFDPELPFDPRVHRFNDFDNVRQLAAGIEKAQ